MQAQRSGLHGEKEETRSTAEEKAAAFERLLFLSRAEGSPTLELLAGLEPATC